MLTPGRESHSEDQPGRGWRMESALAPEKGGDPRSGEDRRNPPSPSWRTSFMEDRGFRVREKARFTHVIAFLRSDVSEKRFSAHGKTTERGNVAKKACVSTPGFITR